MYINMYIDDIVLNFIYCCILICFGVLSKAQIATLREMLVREITAGGLM